MTLGHPHPRSWRRRPDDRNIVFLHLPRTAGTTLNSILSRLYEPGEMLNLGTHVQDALAHFRSLSEEQRARIKVLYGHTAFGVHELLSPPTTYITLLRDPVERVVSFYYFVARHPHHYHFPFVWSEATTPAGYITSGQTIATDNYMVRQVSGVLDAVPFGELGPEQVELAKNNLTQHFAVAGIQERFNETLLLMARMFGWRDVFYVPLNATSDRPATAQLDKRQLDAIAELNRYDIELYRYAAEQFDDKVRASGRWLGAAARVFGRVNPGAARVLRVAADAERRGLGRPAVSGGRPGVAGVGGRVSGRVSEAVAPVRTFASRRGSTGAWAEPLAGERLGDDARFAYALWRYVPGMRWAVIDAGDGAFVARLRDAGLDATGVESDSRLVAKAMPAVRRELRRPGSDGRLPYEQGHVDSALVMGGLVGRGEVATTALLAELRRVCNVLAVVALATWSTAEELSDLLHPDRREYYQFLGQSLGDAAYEGPLPESDLRPDLRLSGWRTAAAGAWWERQAAAAGWERAGAMRSPGGGWGKAVFPGGALWLLETPLAPAISASLRPEVQARALAERWGVPYE